MFLAARPDSYFYVLTQSGEEFHEARDGKSARAIPHQQGDLRLPHTKNFGDFGLRHPATLEDRVDLQCELGLDQFLLRVWKPKVRENVSASFEDPCNAPACVFCFGFHF
ncbi:MAG: hypothetical protein JWN92_1038 [Candidatus Acidoferrum typicum]|nr:hypothetical protein [Candidatus Acidoferrum typicum]